MNCSECDAGGDTPCGVDCPREQRRIMDGDNENTYPAEAVRTAAENGRITALRQIQRELQAMRDAIPDGGEGTYTRGVRDTLAIVLCNIETSLPK